MDLWLVRSPLPLASVAHEPTLNQSQVSVPTHWRSPRRSHPRRARYSRNLKIREAIPGDGAAIARIRRENAAYYAGLAPELFRLPDDDGLDEFADPTADDNSSRALFILAEIDEEVVGHLYAEVVSPGESDRFQASSDGVETRLFIHALSVLQQHWRKGIATALVETAEVWGRERGATVALCDTWPESPVSLPFWEQRMRYEPRSVRLRKQLIE